MTDYRVDIGARGIARVLGSKRMSSRPSDQITGELRPLVKVPSLGLCDTGDRIG